MAKYENLSLHLESLDSRRWTATFSEIERILGFPLPKSALSYPAWWANQTGNGHSHSNAWQDFGWRTGELDLVSQKITFFRQASDFQRPAPATAVLDRHGHARPLAPLAKQGPSEAVERQKPGSLTMAEAKAGLAAHFGVPSESIEITIKG